MRTVNDLIFRRFATCIWDMHGLHRVVLLSARCPTMEPPSKSPSSAVPWFLAPAVLQPKQKTLGATTARNREQKEGYLKGVFKLTLHIFALKKKQKQKKKTDSTQKRWKWAALEDWEMKTRIRHSIVSGKQPYPRQATRTWEVQDIAQLFLTWR